MLNTQTIFVSDQGDEHFVNEKKHINFKTNNFNIDSETIIFVLTCLYIFITIVCCIKCDDRSDRTTAALLGV